MANVNWGWRLQDGKWRQNILRERTYVARSLFLLETSGQRLHQPLLALLTHLHQLNSQQSRCIVGDVCTRIWQGRMCRILKKGDVSSSAASILLLLFFQNRWFRCSLVLHICVGDSEKVEYISNNEYFVWFVSWLDVDCLLLLPFPVAKFPSSEMNRWKQIEWKQFWRWSGEEHTNSGQVIPLVWFVSYAATLSAQWRNSARREKVTKAF